VQIRAVPSGAELGIKGGKAMKLGFSSKIPLGAEAAPSAWTYDMQGGIWQETLSAVTADESKLAAPNHGGGFATLQIYSEGNSKGQDLTDWGEDVTEILGSGPKTIKRALPAEPAPEPDPEAEDYDPEAEPEPPVIEYEEVRHAEYCLCWSFSRSFCALSLLAPPPGGAMEVDEVQKPGRDSQTGVPL
jgi:hypothetical protein